MKKICLVVQAEDSLTNRQRVIVNPERYRNVRELLEVLSAELRHADGSCMLLAPTTPLSILDMTTGAFKQLSDVTTIPDNARLRIDRQHRLTSAKSASPGGKQQHGSSAAATIAAPNNNSSSSNSAAAALDKSSSMYDLLTYHAKIVAFLSSHMSVEKEITAQDIQSVCEGTNAIAESLVDQLSFSQMDFLSSARVLTQLALQRGKCERDSNDGEEAMRMRQSLSVYQARIDRLESELAKATNLYDATLSKLNAVLQDRERSTTSMSELLDSLRNEKALQTKELKRTRQSFCFVQKEADELAAGHERMKNELASHRNSLFSLPTTSPKAAAAVQNDMFNSAMPCTLEEERFLALTSGSWRPRTASAAGTMQGTISRNLERNASVTRPDHGGGEPSTPKGATGQRRRKTVDISHLVTDDGTPHSGGGAGEGGSLTAARSVQTVQVYFLGKSGQQSKEVIRIDKSITTFSRFYEAISAGLVAAARSENNARSSSVDSSAAAARLDLDLGYFRDGDRYSIRTNADVQKFLAAKSSGGDLVLNCYEIVSDNATGGGVQSNGKTIPSAAFGINADISITPYQDASRVSRSQSLAMNARDSVTSVDGLERLRRISHVAPRGHDVAAQRDAAGSGGAGGSATTPGGGGRHHPKLTIVTEPKSGGGADSEDDSNMDNASATSSPMGTAVAPANLRLLAAKFLGKTVDQSDANSEKHFMSRSSSGTSGLYGNDADASRHIRPRTADPLSTRSLFMSVGATPVPSELEMRDEFQKLGAVDERDSLPRAVVVQYLAKRYDDMGNPRRFSLIVESQCPSSAAGGVSFSAFYLIILRVMRE